MKKLYFLILPVLFLVFTNPALAKIYKWTDESGKVHFTDNPAKVPEQYRQKEPKKNKPKSAEGGTRVDLGGGYSLVLAENWYIEKRGSLRYKLIFTKKRNGYEPSCALDEFKIGGSFESFVTNLQATIRKRYKNYKKNSQAKFYAKHLKGIRVSEQLIDMSGDNVRRFLYYFNISNEKKIVITCSVAEATGTELNDAFDGIASSLIYE